MVPSLYLLKHGKCNTMEKVQRNGKRKETGNYINNSANY